MWSYPGNENPAHESSANKQHLISAALESGSYWLELAANGEHGTWYLAELSFRGASQLIWRGPG